MPYAEFSALLGLTLSSVQVNDEMDEVTFVTDKGRKFRMSHTQDCCEHVTLEEVWGDWKDIVGRKVTLAEQVTHSGDDGDDDSSTWTFYHVGTNRGVVTMRWCGRSNGYYSESVDFEEVK